MTTSRNILTPWEYYKRPDGTIIRSYDGTTQYLLTRTRCITWRNTPIPVRREDTSIPRAAVSKERVTPRPLYTYWRSPVGYIYRRTRGNEYIQLMIVGNDGHIAWAAPVLHERHLNSCAEVSVKFVSKEFITLRNTCYARTRANSARTRANTTTNTGEKDEC